MSTALAIAAATATIQALLKPVVGNGGSLTAKPLATARKGVTGAQLNLCLYHVGINPALRNNPDALYRPPTRTPDGSLVLPLPLNIYYLVTAFADTGPNAEIFGHMLLGQAMSILHDHALLGADEIKKATDGLSLNVPGLGDSTLHEQVERVRITPQPITGDEMTKLWTAAQVGYSPSFAYEVSVVLIESERAAATPVPVLRRGPDNRGPVAVAGAAGPEITRVVLPDGRGVAFGGDPVRVEGRGLAGDNADGAARVILTPGGGGAPETIAPGPSSDDGQITFALDDDTSPPPGVYSLSVDVGRETGAETRRWTSNALPLVVVRRVTALMLDGVLVPTTAVTREVTLAAGQVTIGMICTPPVRVAAPTGGGALAYTETVALLFPRNGKFVPIQPEPPTTPNAAGTAANPLEFIFAVAATEIDTTTDPAGNVKALRLRGGSAELPSIMVNPDGPGFETRVRIKP